MLIGYDLTYNKNASARFSAFAFGLMYVRNFVLKRVFTLIEE